MAHSWLPGTHLLTRFPLRNEKHSERMDGMYKLNWHGVVDDDAHPSSKLKHTNKSSSIRFIRLYAMPTRRSINSQHYKNNFYLFICVLCEFPHFRTPFSVFRDREAFHRIASHFHPSPLVSWHPECVRLFRLCRLPALFRARLHLFALFWLMVHVLLLLLFRSVVGAVDIFDAVVVVGCCSVPFICLQKSLLYFYL